jgi:Nucleotidyltransferase domain
MANDPILEIVVPGLVEVPGIAAIVLGGSRARDTASAGSDYDLGLYIEHGAALDTSRLLDAVRTFVDRPQDAAVTPVGEWGKWIVGGGWLSVRGHKVDLLYRNLEDVAEVIRSCSAGGITMDYQPGHPHGFCSAIWMGEVALCRPLHDPSGRIAQMKRMTSPYPEPLARAIVRRFQWEIAFGIDNARGAVGRGDATHIAGCVYRALCCVAQVLFAINRRYLINEKGALSEAAAFPLTPTDLSSRVASVWAAIGRREFELAFRTLALLDQDLAAMATEQALLEQ